MAKSLIVDRVKVIAEMARQNLTAEELAQKAGVGRSVIWKMRQSKAVWRTSAQHVARGCMLANASLQEFRQPEAAPQLKQRAAPAAQIGPGSKTI